MHNTERRPRLRERRTRQHARTHAGTHERTRAHAHSHTRARARARTHARTHTKTDTYTHARTHARTHTDTCIDTHEQALALISSLICSYIDSVRTLHSNTVSQLVSHSQTTTQNQCGSCCPHVGVRSRAVQSKPFLLREENSASHKTGGRRGTLFPVVDLAVCMGLKNVRAEMSVSVYLCLFTAR